MTRVLPGAGGGGRPGRRRGADDAVGGRAREAVDRCARRGGGHGGCEHEAGDGGCEREAGHGGAESGSAVVDFVLVSLLVVLLFLGVVQVALAQHVRSVLADSAAEGARYGAPVGRTPDDAVDRTRELVTADLSARYAAHVEARYVDHDGVPVVEVTVSAPLPVVGLLGPGGVVDVVGHAVREPR